MPMICPTTHETLNESSLNGETPTAASGAATAAAAREQDQHFVVSEYRVQNVRVRESLRAFSSGEPAAE
jgi:hypothetical protein